MIAHPKTWRVKSLEEVAEVQTGLAKGKTDLKDPVTMPYLRVANVQDGFLDLSEIKSIQVGRGELDRYRLRRNDVLLTEGGDLDKLGRGFIWHGQIEPCLHQNHVFVVRTRSEVLRPEFLALLTASAYGRRYFLGCAKRTTNLASVNSTQLKQFPVLLPSVGEQDAVASLLGVWDAGAGLLNARLEAAQSRRLGLMQQLLTGRKRFKEFNGERWRTFRLGELLQEVDRYVTFNDEHTYKLASIRRRSEGLFFRGALQGKNIKTKVMKTIRSGDFLLSKMQVVHGAWGLVTPEFDGMFVSDSYVALVPRDGSALKIEFLNYLSRMRFMRHLAYISSHGVHIEKMTFNLDDFLHEKITIPPTVEEQAKIVDVLSACDREIELLHKQLDALKEQKRGLMQKLLMGEMRVKPEMLKAENGKRKAGIPSDEDSTPNIQVGPRKSTKE
jgi:type I restriction enzyme S subunit